MASQNLGFWKQEITGQHLYLAWTHLKMTSIYNISFYFIYVALHLVLHTLLMPKFS